MDKQLCNHVKNPVRERQKELEEPIWNGREREETMGEIIQEATPGELERR